MSTITSGQVRPACSEIAASAFTSASTEPTDRSIPAVVITKVIATATIMSGAVCRKILRRLVWVRNVSVMSENVTAITTKKTAMLTTPPLSWMISLARSRSALGAAIGAQERASLSGRAPAETERNFLPTMRLTISSIFVSPISRSATLRPS